MLEAQHAELQTLLSIVDQEDDMPGKDVCLNNCPPSQRQRQPIHLRNWLCGEHRWRLLCLKLRRILRYDKITSATPVTLCSANANNRAKDGRNEAYARFAEIGLHVENTRYPEVAATGELPQLRDGHFLLPSNEIISHMQEFHSDIDKGLTEGEKAESYAYKRLIEDSLKPSLAYSRWVDEENYKQVVRPAVSRVIPFPLNCYLPNSLRKKNTSRLAKWGIRDVFEANDRAREAFKALNTRLGDRRVFYGDKPSSLDAEVFGIVVDSLSDLNLRKVVVEYAPNLVELARRIKDEYFSRDYFPHRNSAVRSRLHTCGYTMNAENRFNELEGAFLTTPARRIGRDWTKARTDPRTRQAKEIATYKAGLHRRRQEEEEEADFEEQPENARSPEEKKKREEERARHRKRSRNAVLGAIAVAVLYLLSTIKIDFEFEDDDYDYDDDDDDELHDAEDHDDDGLDEEDDEDFDQDEEDSDITRKECYEETADEGYADQSHSESHDSHDGGDVEEEEDLDSEDTQSSEKRDGESYSKHNSDFSGSDEDTSVHVSMYGSSSIIDDAGDDDQEDVIHVSDDE